MNPAISLDHCLSFINCQLQPPGATVAFARQAAARRAVTISRQTGSGGHAVAERLVELLRVRDDLEPGLEAAFAQLRIHAVYVAVAYEQDLEHRIPIARSAHLLAFQVKNSLKLSH